MTAPEEIERDEWSAPEGQYIGPHPCACSYVLHVEDMETRLCDVEERNASITMMFQGVEHESMVDSPCEYPEEGDDPESCPFFSRELGEPDDTEDDDES